MTIKTLYRFNREGGGVTNSLTLPEGVTEYTERYRIIADEGCTLTFNGEETGTVVDTDTTEGYEEIGSTEATEEDYINALAELGVTDDEESNA